MGIAHYQKGEKRKAKDSFEKVRELGGKMNGLYGPLADCYRSTGSRSESLAVINEGIQLNEQEAWLYSIWGKLLEDQQEYDAAISKFNRAVELKDEPWSGYAKKQIARQTQLKKRAELIAQQKEG
jgi:tetratricopeptide (TPR) repeat protein